VRLWYRRALAIGFAWKVPNHLPADGMARGKKRAISLDALTNMAG
jgi:hypothetical protein